MGNNMRDWYVGQKIGRADEHKQYRRLFKADNDFFDEHVVDIGNIPPGEPSNWYGTSSVAVIRSRRTRRTMQSARF